MKPHRARRRFGQNFLVDTRVIERIAAAINGQVGEHIVEIGPGRGALTRELLQCGARLTAIELDRDLIPLLLAEFGDVSRFKLINCDALEVDYARLGHDHPLRVVGNLPYNISTPLLFRLLDAADAIADMHFMLQKEVVDRLAAEPGSGAWGRLGIMVQYRCRVESLFRVPPGAFSPVPRVESAIVRITPHAEPPYPANDPAHFARIVRDAFNKRRKTLRNALASSVTAEQFEAAGIDPGQRAEQLTMPQLVALSNVATKK